MTMPDDEAPGGDPSLLIELARDQLGYQQGAADAAETKAGIFFGVGSTLLGVLVAIVALKPPHTAWSIAAACAVTASYVVLTGASLWAYRTDEWKIGPDIRKVSDVWPKRSLQTNKLAALQTVLTAYEYNDRTSYRHKMKRAQVTAYALFAETLTLGVLALLIALGD
jgi:putative flippase GtrA